MLIAIIDILFSLILTIMVVWRNPSLIDKRALRYMTPLVVLVYVHVIGNTLQELSIGPEWIQDHLHNAGMVSGRVFSFFVMFYLLGWIKGTWCQTPLAATVLFIKMMPMAHTLGTLLFISIEVAYVTLFRDNSINQGYSGELDIGDCIAYMVGLAVCLVNHWLNGRPLLAKLS